MPQLPSPELVSRQAPRPGGVSGQLSDTLLPDIAPDTAIADTLTRIGDEGYADAMQEKARLDQVAFDDAKNQYMTETLKLKEEVYSIKGRDAVDRDIDKEYTSKSDSISERLSNKLKNDTQRRAWNSYYGSAKTDFRAKVIQHKMNESDNWSQEVSAASINNNQISAIANAHNDTEVLKSEFAIKEAVARELVRTGNNEDKEISTYEMNEALSPMWFGVIKERINSQQYDSANELLESKKSILGKNHGVLVEYMKKQDIDVKAQGHRDEIYNKFETWEKRLNYARSSLSGEMEEAVITKLKTLKNEEDVLAADDKNKQIERDSAWMADKGVEALNKGMLTIADVEAAGLSDKNEALWKKMVYEYDEQRSKAKASMLDDMSKNTYADLSVKITLNPEEYTNEDLAKFVGPNTGKLTAQQFRTLVDDLKKAKDAKLGTGTTSAKQESRGTDTLKIMYERGDFGKVKTGEDKYSTESWKLYSNVHLDYKQRFREDPEGDHRQWLNDRIQEEGEKILAKRLDDDFTLFGFGDDSVEIAKEFLEERGIEPTPEKIQEAIEGTKPISDIPEAAAKKTKTVKAKLMKRKDGTYYILYPNGTTKEATIDKDGKVSF